MQISHNWIVAMKIESYTNNKGMKKNPIIKSYTPIRPIFRRTRSRVCYIGNNK